MKTLIDKAANVCGSQTALAIRLGLNKSQLSEMKRGRRPIAPELAILIADVAMQDVADAALAAIVENGHGTKRGELVQAILGRALINKMLSTPLLSKENDLVVNLLAK